MQGVGCVGCSNKTNKTRRLALAVSSCHSKRMQILPSDRGIQSGPGAMAIFALFLMSAGLWPRPILAAQTSMGAAAAASNLKVAKDFKVELLYTVPKATEG